MRNITITIIILLTYHYIFGQTECKCTDHPNYNNFINCDTITFNNEAKIYRQFNCNNSWLTFEGNNHKKKILYSLNKEIIDLTPKLGYQFVKEYSTVLLFANHQVSGGGLPINYELLDKNNGELKKELGPIVYYSDNDTDEYIVTFLNDSIPSFLKYDIKNNMETEHNILNIEDEILDFMSSDMFAEIHFRNPKMEDGFFTIEYTYKVSENENWLKTKISAELLTIENHLSNDLLKLERKIDSIYSKLNGKLIINDKVALKKSQEDWKRYRDSSCLFLSRKYTGGVIANKMFIDCKIQTTELRIIELTEILKDGF